VSTAQVSTTIDEENVRNLPNLDRNVLALANMAPGVANLSTGGIEGGSQDMNITGLTANVNGNHNQRNNFYLDGTDSSGAFRNESTQYPNPDAVQELQVSTANGSAEMARQIGGVFNVITKNGTNRFHGDAFYFFRPTALDADTWSNKHYPTVVPTPTDNEKQVGGVVGGPIRRNKTFFFLSFMRYSNSTQGTVNNVRGLTSAMKAGDFSAATVDPVTGQPLQLFNPDTGAMLTGNIIPSSLIDPVGQAFIKEVPTVNAWGDNYTWTYQQPVVNQEWLGKLEHHWSDKNLTTFSLLRTIGQGTFPATNAASVCCVLNDIPNYPGETDYNNQWTISMHHAYTPTSTLIVEGYAAMVRQDSNRTMSAFGTTLASLGAQNFPISQKGAHLYEPGWFVSGGAQAEQGWLSLFIQSSYQFGGKVTWIKGKHSIKLGTDTVREQVDQIGDQDYLAFNFDGRFSGTSALNPGVSYQYLQAAGYADMLMGRTFNFGQNGILHENPTSWQNYYFVEDTWKINNRLTLTPGVRYEFYLPTKAENGAATAYIAGHQSTQFPSAPLGLAFPKDPGVPSGFLNVQWDEIAPRIGAAYDLRGDGKWAIRAGFGEFFSYNSAQVAMVMSESAPWQPAAQCTGYARLANPWLTCTYPTYSAPPTPLQPVTGGNYNWGTQIAKAYGFAPGFVQPHSFQWNVSLQHALTKDIALTAGYVGNTTNNMTEMIPQNWARWAPNASLANIGQRQPNPNYNYIGLFQNTGKESYNGLQVVLNVRKRSVNSTITYVEQRAYDNITGDDPTSGNSATANPECPSQSCERGESIYHRELRAFATWDMPFFRHSNNWTSKMLGGWQLSGQTDIASGAPGNVVLGEDWNYDGVSGDRPDKVSNVRYVKQNLNPTSPYAAFEQWFDVGAATSSPQSALTRGPFALPGGGTNHDVFGDLKRNAIFNPGNFSADASVMKNFHLTEAQYFQFRLDAQNVFNHPNLWGPDLNYVDPTFGQISGKGGNRLVQLGFKYYF
jgi:hypothetical protein